MVNYGSSAPAKGATKEQKEKTTEAVKKAAKGDKSKEEKENG